MPTHSFVVQNEANKREGGREEEGGIIRESGRNERKKEGGGERGMKRERERWKEEG